MGRSHAGWNRYYYEEVNIKMKPENPPGTHYKKADLDAGKIIYTEDMLEIWYRWSLGKYLSKYLEGFKEGKILGRRCNVCGRTYVPPREVCQYCFRETDEWVELRDTGRVNTAVVSYIAADRSKMEKPLVIAVIEIDGASEGMGMLHKLGEVDPEDVKTKRIFGKRVKAVWKPVEERTGSVTDILYFKPVEEVD